MNKAMIRITIFSGIFLLFMTSRHLAFAQPVPDLNLNGFQYIIPNKFSLQNNSYQVTIKVKQSFDNSNGTIHSIPPRSALEFNCGSTISIKTKGSASVSYRPIYKQGERYSIEWNQGRKRWEVCRIL